MLQACFQHRQLNAHPQAGRAAVMEMQTCETDVQSQTKQSQANTCIWKNATIVLKVRYLCKQKDCN